MSTIRNALLALYNQTILVLTITAIEDYQTAKEIHSRTKQTYKHMSYTLEMFRRVSSVRKHSLNNQNELTNYA